MYAIVVVVESAFVIIAVALTFSNFYPHNTDIMKMYHNQRININFWYSAHRKLLCKKATEIKSFRSKFHISVQMKWNKKENGIVLMHEVFGFIVPTGDFVNKSDRFSLLTKYDFVRQQHHNLVRCKQTNWRSRRKMKKMEKKVPFLEKHWMTSILNQTSTWDPYLLWRPTQNPVEKIVFYQKSIYEERLCVCLHSSTDQEEEGNNQSCFYL